MEEKVIDASVLEGGGQIFRISLAIASLLRFKCEIHSIRSKRPNPGLAKQHLPGSFA
jgi:RNA 3'-terminal phosphate cyclase (ATP)